MSTDERVVADRAVPLRRADGVTEAERYLKKLCDHSFLSLWSYPGVYRDQGRGGKAGDGKEVCELLVVFEDHIIIFSDKDCQFPNTGDIELDWSRWYRKAIQKSAEQVWGAERWIKTYPDRMFLDRACTQPFPLDLPDPARAKFHRVVVAHDGARRCREELRGSGSLMIAPDIIGPAHCTSLADGGRPFMVGQVDPSRGFVHVFDDTTLDVVMRMLDTVTDFMSYLEKKEKFILSGRLCWAAGEEDLLAYYLKYINEAEEHDFVIPEDLNFVSIGEGLWEHFTRSPERRNQQRADEISYSWDMLIEKFLHHIFENTQHYTTCSDLKEQEKMFRFLAREPRTRRRMLAKSIIELISRTPVAAQRAARVMLPSRPGDPHYVFLLLTPFEGATYEQYREVRRELLSAYCMVVKLKCPEALDIIGIATETGDDESRSEDAIYLDARDWPAEAEAEARRLQDELGLLRDTAMFASTENEYPDGRVTLRPISDQRQSRQPRGLNVKRSKKPSLVHKNKIGRGAPCPCQSGKTFRRCCGKESS